MRACRDRVCTMCQLTILEGRSVCDCSKWPHFEGGVKSLLSQRGPRHNNCTNGTNNTHFQTVCQHSVALMKSDGSSCVKNDKRELERERNSKPAYSLNSNHLTSHCLRGQCYQTVNFRKIQKCSDTTNHYPE